MQPPLHYRIINYGLVVAIFFWVLIAVSVLMQFEYSLGTLFIWIAIVLLSVSAVGIWRHDPYYYKVVLAVMSMILVFDVTLGKGVGPEIVLILLSLYLWTKASQLHERRNLSKVL